MSLGADAFRPGKAHRLCPARATAEPGTPPLQTASLWATTCEPSTPGATTRFMPMCPSWCPCGRCPPTTAIWARRSGPPESRCRTGGIASRQTSRWCLLTLGTSGRADLLPMALSALSRAPDYRSGRSPRADSTLQRRRPPTCLQRGLSAAGCCAVRRSALVICNGGSLTTYQALEVWRARPRHLHQYGSAAEHERHRAPGSGPVAARSPRSASDLRDAVLELLEYPFLRAGRHGRRATRFRTVNAGQRFRAFVAEILPSINLGRPGGSLAQDNPPADRGVLLLFTGILALGVRHAPTGCGGHCRWGIFAASASWPARWCSSISMVLLCIGCSCGSCRCAKANWPKGRARSSPPKSTSCST